MSTITIKNALKKYGDTTVIEGLNLEIKDGELFTLLGPSGCGKTTLLRMIAGFNSIEGGDFYFNDERINDKDPAKRNIGMVFQNYAVFPHLTVRKNVAFGLNNRKLDKKTVAEETDRFLKMMKIDEYADRLPQNLSGGQQQRVALARALAVKPDVLLMDEPLSNLDAKLRLEMRQAIRNIQRELGITTVYVTHDQEEAMSISDTIAVMDHGVIQHLGAPKEIYQRPANLFVSNFIGKMNFFNSKVVSADRENIVARINTTDIDVVIPREKAHLENPAAGMDVLVGGRPEQLVVSRTKSSDSVMGKVNIIQHLGSFIRYEVEIADAISPAVFEIDMPTLQKDIHEQDIVYVNLKRGLASLFSPEGRE